MNKAQLEETEAVYHEGVTELFKQIAERDARIAELEAALTEIADRKPVDCSCCDGGEYLIECAQDALAKKEQGT